MVSDGSDSLGHAWFLKQSKLRKAWLVDPFTVHKDGRKLVALRCNKRMLVMHESPYVMDNLTLSPLRSLTHEEFAAIVTSELGSDLPDDYTVSRIRCFDIKFKCGGHEKCMTVIGKYNETVMNVRRVMLSHLEELEEANLSQSHSIEAISGSTNITPSYHDAASLFEPVGPLPAVVCSRLTMTMDDNAVDLGSLDLDQPDSETTC